MTHILARDVVRFRETTVAGVPIRHTTGRALVRFLDRKRAGNTPLAIAFVNQNFVVACRHLHPIARGDARGILLLNDGVGVTLAARLLTGRGFRENLNGTDLIPLLLRDVKRDLDVFLLGSTPEIIARARRVIDAMPRRRVVGAIDGFSIWRNEAEAVAAINTARPDILLVGFGNPKQELWILRHRRELDVGIIMAVGAVFEWMTGARRRAPLIVRRAGAEWLYRLATEPRRLFRRYTIDVVRFFFFVWRDRKSGRRPASDRSSAGRRQEEQVRMRTDRPVVADREAWMAEVALQPRPTWTNARQAPPVAGDPKA